MMKQAALFVAVVAVATQAVSLTDAMEKKYVGVGASHEQNGKYPSFWYDCLVIKRSGSDACLYVNDDGSLEERDCPKKDDPKHTFHATDDTNSKTKHHNPKVFFVSNTTPLPPPELRDAEHTALQSVLTYDHRDNTVKMDAKGDIHDINEVTGILMRQTWQPANFQGTHAKTIGILDGRLLHATLPTKYAHNQHVDFSHNKRSMAIDTTMPHYREAHHISESHQVLWQICKCPSRGGCTEAHDSL